MFRETREKEGRERKVTSMMKCSMSSATGTLTWTYCPLQLTGHLDVADPSQRDVTVLTDGSLPVRWREAVVAGIFSFSAVLRSVLNPNCGSLKTQTMDPCGPQLYGSLWSQIAWFSVTADWGFL